MTNRQGGTSLNTYAVYATKNGKGFFVFQDQFKSASAAKEFWSEEMIVLRRNGWSAQVLVKQ